jgi:tetratricopeptide (TPR) repeat protein
MITKEDILNEIKNKNDEVKLEHLEKLVKNIAVDQDVRKEAFIIMAEIFIKKMWWGNAAKAYSNAADLAKTFDGKKDLFFKAGELFVRTQDYFTAEDIFRKVLVLSVKKDRKMVQDQILGVYLNFGKELEEKRLQTKAISVYNKILTLNLPVEKANEIRDKMAFLYDKIGKPREANWIRAQKASAVEEDKKKVPVEEKKDEGDGLCAQDFI